MRLFYGYFAPLEKDIVALKDSRLPDLNQMWELRLLLLFHTASRNQLLHKMKRNKDVVIEFVKATNEKDWEKVLSLVHRDFVRHSSSMPNEIKSNLGLIDFHKVELDTFPDLQEKIIFAIAF